MTSLSGNGADEHTGGPDMHVQATVTAIDLTPEFGDITGDEATVTVLYAHPLYRNAPPRLKTIGVTKAEAARLTVGGTMAVIHV